MVTLKENGGLIFMLNDYELLNRIHKNTQMGLETLPLLSMRAEDTTFRDTIRKQITEYRDLNRKAERLMRDSGFEVQSVSPMAKMSATVMTNVKTLMDTSTSHLAEIVIQGSNMGVTQITRAMHRSRPGDASVRALADQLLRADEKNIKTLREFL